MTAFTDSIGFEKGAVAFRAYGHLRVAFMETYLDFETIVAARLAAGATALAAADTLQVLQLPAGALVLQGGAEVEELELTNTTGTFDIGFTGGSPAAANVFANDVAINALSKTATGLAAPILITADDTLDILLNTAVGTNAVIRVWALVVDTNG